MRRVLFLLFPYCSGNSSPLMNIGLESKYIYCSLSPSISLLPIKNDFFTSPCVYV